MPVKGFSPEMGSFVPHVSTLRSDTLFVIVLQMLRTNPEFLCWMAAILDFSENRKFFQL